jgi:hypothetical protein
MPAWVGNGAPRQAVAPGPRRARSSRGPEARREQVPPHPPDADHRAVHPYQYFNQYFYLHLYLGG